jgi:hypothetical protein
LDRKTVDEWKHDPGHLLRPDMRGSVATGLGKDGKKSAMELQREIEELIKLMAATPGYETLAKNADAILNFKVNPSENDDWYAQVFNDFLAWVLIYLDGLESDLSFIKASSSPTGAPV